MKGDIENIVHEYELEKALSEFTRVDAVTLVTLLIDQLSHSSFSLDRAAKKQDHLFNELITSTKPITEIKIVRGGVEYVFKDKVKIEMLTDRIEDWNREGFTMEELSEATEELFQPAIEIVRPLFNKLTNLSERKRHLIIHEMFRLAKYPFTKQQLAASQQSKAVLIGNWLKRSTPKISTSKRNKKTKKSS